MFSAQKIILARELGFVAFNLAIKPVQLPWKNYAHFATIFSTFE